MSFVKSAPKWQICQAMENDLPFLKEIELCSASLFPPGFLPTPDETISESVLLKAIMSGRLFICKNAGSRPVGFALWKSYGKFALLAEIDVLPEYGRQGIGTALVGRIAADAAKAGFQVLFLTTFGNLPWNAPFYKKLGFTIPDETDLPEEIRLILAEERERGMENRVAMRLITGSQ